MKTTLLILLAFITATPLRADENPSPEPKLPVIPPAVFKVADYGARGDGTTMNTAALQSAIDACRAAGGGRVVLPAGTFVSGPLSLASRVALVLELGAILQASARFSDFGLPEELPAKQAEIDAVKGKLRPFISGTKLEDVAILGEGTIDGAGAAWWAKSDVAARRAAFAEPAAPALLYVPRPHLIVLRDCARVRLQGVTLKNSPMFHVVPHHCQDVTVEDVSILTPADAPNTDGIDPANSRDVLIRRCTIDTGDDNIALKGGGVGGPPTENVTVTECKFLHGHGVSIGSETQAGVRNFLVERCSFENTVTALRIKSDRTRGGVVEHVRYRDLTMKNVETALSISLFYDDRKAAARPELKPVTPNTPIIRDIVFSNITCDGATKRAGEIAGLPESPIDGVTLENVRITGAAGPFTQQDTRNLRLLNFDVQTVSPETKTP